MTSPPASRVALGLALAGSLVPAPALAQRYFVHTYSETDGLPSSTTNDVVQDPEGLMWFATRTGVARYDGFEWTSFSTPDGLATPDQAGLAVDESGTLWAAAGARPFSVASFGGGRWNLLPAAAVSVALGERASDFAVTRYDGRALAAIATTHRRLSVWDGEQWLEKGAGLELGTAPRMAACRGRFFLATERGLATTLPGSVDFALEPIEGMPSARLLGVGVERETAETACQLWLAGEDWVGRWSDRALTLVAEGVPLDLGPGYEYLAVEPDRRGGVFVGNPLGLRYVRSGAGVEELTLATGLIAVGATSILVDRERNVWVGSLRGVSKVASFRFGNYDEEHGLLEDEVTAVLERRRGGIVLGHSRGLSFLDGGEARTLVLARPDVPASTTRVLDLAEDETGNLWVAGSGLGLARIDSSGIVRWHAPESAPEVVNSVLAARDGTLWALGNSSLYRVVPGGFERVREGPAGRSRRLFEGADGTLYVAMGQGGVHVRRGGRWARWRLGEAEADDVFAILEGPGDEVWIGTAAGLFLRREGRIERALLAGRPVERRVYFLVRDATGRLWIGTDNGVLRWDPVRGRLRHFTVLDGLAGRETNRAAGVLDSRGRVWIGTERGVSVYDSSRERSEPVVPAPVLGPLEADGRRYALDEPVELSPGRGELRFEFRAPSFVDESRLKYQTRLEGYEDAWTAPYSTPNIRYTNLPPGRYSLHLRASVAGGDWSPPVSSAPIVIPRPFVGSPLFYALLASVAGWGLYLVQGYVSQRRYSRRLEGDVRERTAELSRLNADLRAEAAERERAESERERLIRELEARNTELESFTYTVSHDLKSPLVTMEGFLGWMEKDVARGDHTRLVRDLELIRSGVQKMEVLLDDLLQLSRVGRVANRPGLVSLRELAEEAVAMVRGEITERGARVVIGDDLPSVFADRLRLLQVVQNLVKNSVRFAGDQPEPLIEIDAWREGGEVVCRVKDDGIGIEPEYQQRVFRLFERLDTDRGGTGVGLAIAQRILEAHGGRIWVESEGAGRGTSVCFALPRGGGEAG